MNIVVCVKHVVDSTEVRVDKNSNELILRGIPTKINDYDKNAIEEAVKIKNETNGHVTLLTIGPREAEKTVKEGLAMGADEALIIDDNSVPDGDSVQIAKVLAEAIKKFCTFDLILCGSISEDKGSGLTAMCLAEWLGIEHVAFVNKIECKGNSIVVEREANQVFEMVESPLPVLLTVDRTINTPRLPSAIQIMKVKANRIRKLTLADLGMERLETNVALDNYRVVNMNRKRMIFENDIAVDDIVKRLAEEGVL